MNPREIFIIMWVFVFYQKRIILRQFHVLLFYCRALLVIEYIFDLHSSALIGLENILGLIECIDCFHITNHNLYNFFLLIYGSI